MLDGIAGRFIDLRKILRKIPWPAFLFALLFTVGATSPRAQAYTFFPTGEMVTTRFEHTATLLGNGKVLIAGGAEYTSSTLPPTELASAELYDPATGAFATTGSMTAARSFHAATLLGNGKVLIVGGSNGSSASLASAELYDPSTGVFTATGSMGTARSAHTATLLNNGKVLIAGGLGAIVLASAELYDPSTGFSPQQAA
jgi:hypothetical protein